MIRDTSLLIMIKALVYSFSNTYNPAGAAGQWPSPCHGEQQASSILVAGAGYKVLQDHIPKK